MAKGKSQEIEKEAAWPPDLALAVIQSHFRHSVAAKEPRFKERRFGLHNLRGVML